MKIEILGTGCAKCKTLYENAKKAVEEQDMQADIIKVEDIDRIVEYGVMMTPAIVINGKIKASGKISSTEEIKRWL